MPTPSTRPATDLSPDPTDAPGGPTPALSFPSLARLRFQLEAQEPIRFPEYAGSAWRGLLGHGLRRTACVTRQPTCAGCLLIRNCVYSTLFETPAEQSDGDGYSALPHPFVLVIDPTAPRQLAAGAPFELGINLIGDAIAQAPYLIHALGLAGQLGVGRAGGRFTLTAVLREAAPGAHDWQEVYNLGDGVYQPLEPIPPTVPPAPDGLRLRFVTPLRIKRAGHFLGVRDLTTADLVQALYRRLRTLARLHGGNPDGFDLHQAARATAGLRLQPQGLSWHEWTRYSSRQDSLMQFGGLIGELTLEGPALPDLWPAFWLGQWTHVGKGTAFGLGGYRVLAAPESAADRKLANTAPDG
ncbi:CRISPR system precrRNA processing endoribonuclease RAMP protein Cas6 [uncultured Thiodictyon sp.]|uniref:CRISPR system precrRNA processing endoribonuclease RAMP protein Cas6 n=1 Tax=uncultured Thiodictyon sp. TaxID=1846217 RepID=UPI0025FF81AB|nr:CRISPR system precrRNA processing endoribonuclease RAMP protein Cas6 [uncultured Thiodictyon sp.]